MFYFTNAVYEAQLRFDVQLVLVCVCKGGLVCLPELPSIEHHKIIIRPNLGQAQ